MTIPVTTRSGKGSPLTPGEMDANLVNLGRDATQAVQGNARFATPAEVSPFAATDLALSPATFLSAINTFFSAYTGDANNMSLGPNGFYRLKNGPVLMWGQVFRNSNAGVGVAFPVLVPALTSIFHVSCNDTNVNNSFLPRPVSITTAGFIIGADNFGPQAVATNTFWFAIGI